ncbi:hypothetical protein [Metallosphaera javensis (ex Hofmann et al. 2022)]|uniref:hypothetical protein n=1 Tax=Metallosphaera javensis (ex Hofmann et al. 2022) TaxID=99938 RepID=UPI001EDD0403|nr:hypothetical protein [Metallosphaera javensis (ex Hofmann et al. 2022)]
MNYTSAIPSFLIITHANGTSFTFCLGSQAIPAFKIAGRSILIYSTSGVLLEKVNTNENMTLIYANFPGLTNEQIPNFRELAGEVDLFPINITTILGIVLGLQLFLVLRRVIR